MTRARARGYTLILMQHGATRLYYARAIDLVGALEEAHRQAPDAKVLHIFEGYQNDIKKPTPTEHYTHPTCTCSEAKAKPKEPAP